MRLGITVALTALAAGVALGQNGGYDWNREAAAKYLDERMDAWFANGKKLRTGDGQTTCVSCHTMLPYALARPALRRAMHVTTAAPQETRMLEEISRRV